MSFNEAVIQYAHKLKNQDKSSLVINTENQGVVHCHFEDDDVMMAVFNNHIGRKITVSGAMDKEQTMILDSYIIHIPGQH